MSHIELPFLGEILVGNKRKMYNRFLKIIQNKSSYVIQEL